MSLVSSLNAVYRYFFSFDPVWEFVRATLFVNSEDSSMVNSLEYGDNPYITFSMHAIFISTEVFQKTKVIRLFNMRNDVPRRLLNAYVGQPKRTSCKRGCSIRTCFGWDEHSITKIKINLNIFKRFVI